MVMPKLNLTESELKEHKKQLHTKYMQKQREKERLWAYKTLVKAVLGLAGIDNANPDEIALKMAENGQFRVYLNQKAEKRPKTPKNTQK